MKKLGILASAVAMTASSLFGDIAVGKGLSVSGYLDITYKNVSEDVSNTDSNGFDAATAEIDFSFDFGNGLSATVDIEGNVGNDGGQNVTSNGTAVGAGASIGSSDEEEVEIEQARIDYAFGDSSITIGKFDTVIGLEALEAPDLYQISNSLTFELEPTQHTGLLYAYDNGFFNVAAGLVNSIGEDNSNSASSEDLSYLFHAGLTPTDALSFNINYAQGDETSSVTPAETDLLTIDASWSDFGWTVGAEYIDSEVETAGTTTTEVDGWMLMANYMFTEQFGLTARYSTVEYDAGNDANRGNSTELTQITISPSYAITPNWFVLAEYTIEEGDAGAADLWEQDTIALETVLTF